MWEITHLPMNGWASEHSVVPDSRQRCAGLAEVGCPRYRKRMIERLIARRLMSSPLLGGVVLIAVGLFCILGEGWLIEGLLPVPAVGALCLGGGAAMAIFGVVEAADTNPVLVIDAERVFARTPPLTRWLTLGFFDRRVRLDKRYIFVEHWWWSTARKSETHPFKAVAHIDYDYLGQGEVDRFTVGLTLSKGQKVPLFTFVGASDSGRPGAQSKLLVAALTKRIGVGIGAEEVPLTDAQGRGWVCLVCGRDGPPNPRPCLYCGGEVAPRD